MAAQLVWTPVDVVSQRLMVQGVCYRNGFDAFRKILDVDDPRGFYRGFGVSIVTYTPSNAVWWASYSMVQKLIWGTWVQRVKCSGDKVRMLVCVFGEVIYVNSIMGEEKEEEKEENGLLKMKESEKKGAILVKRG
ncbi:hypothetical protein LR48_Vigan01g047300 [Vigna angularis]|uniref:Solute carrier family 25 member 44 n=1 Tax=Phaseolus angularis TaxID=3914 RepID=A0A0L9TJX5_PHAAN|nr:hypothetical protein LR48_Vigan01g047300 [Vigna angularis]